MHFSYINANKSTAHSFYRFLIALITVWAIFGGGCFSDDIIQSSNRSELARQHYLIAKKELSSNELNSALTNINKAITLQSNYYYYYLRQRISKSLMHWDSCAKDGQTLIQLEPGFFESYLFTAECNHRIGKYREAIDAYTWFLSEQGLKRADLFFKRGNSYSLLGAAGKATSDWEYACELDISYCDLSGR